MLFYISMAAVSKAALKAAKTALDAQDYDGAVAQARKVLEADSANYHANVFLGLAYDKLGKFEDSDAAYAAATKIKDNDQLVYQGLVSLYEKQGREKLGPYKNAVLKLADIYAQADDRDRCQGLVDKFVGFSQKNGSREDYKRALEVTLPESPVYDFLEGRFPHPSFTYVRIAEIIETEEKERINKEIGQRRTRLGAKIDQVTADVKREVYIASGLEDIYQHVIDWSNDDEQRRQYEEKLLQRKHDLLLILPAPEKAGKREQVEKMAQGMVIIKHPFLLAWQIALEWKDSEHLADWDANVLREFIDFFPDSGVGKVLKGFVESEISPFPAPSPQGTEDKEHDDERIELLTPEDRLLLMTEGLDESQTSILSNRIMAEYYLYLEEFGSAADASRSAQSLVKHESRQTGLSMIDTLDAIIATLGTALVSYQSPRHHPEAKGLFEGILKRKPNATSALLGIGLIYEEDEDYTEAVSFLSQASQRDSGNLKIEAELAWCRALDGDYAQGLANLQKTMGTLKTRDVKTRDLRAEILYRIGYCQWNLETSKAARKDRNGAYASFLACLQVNMNYAPAYTSLGLYYADYAKDKKRARKCFQKAFELSSNEVEAAERLARAFADQGDWDLVEAVAQRVVDAGKARPAPGSKRKGFSWPFAALGVVQLNKQEYPRSIVSYQSALRIAPMDYHSWIGLGESYHNSGRYIAATKAFTQAEKVEEELGLAKSDESWFSKYMLANVKRELGEYGDAIAGYEGVLQIKPKEFGVAIALLQTLVDDAWRNVELGLFGRAADGAEKALDVAAEIATYRADAFNLWKAVGDACAVFSNSQPKSTQIPFSRVRPLLCDGLNEEAYELHAEYDGVGKAALKTLSDEDGDVCVPIRACQVAILCHKRAVHVSSHDVHAQAVAYYNLGWAEHRAHLCVSSTPEGNKVRSGKEATKFLRAAMRCFKRAIELEGGNAEFWNSLGVVTTQLNPKVAQHSFVRSLHLNDRNAQVWTNLGTLYLLNGDYQLANEAFTKGQSADPNYAHAWLGQGLLALLYEDKKEARSLFTHAFDIADSSSILAKRMYATSTFDHLLESPTVSGDVVNLIQPLFALHQLQNQASFALPFQHLTALFAERVGDFSESVKVLETVSSKIEAQYEETESTSSLARFAQVKADLARAQLASGDFESATENAETALDLSAEEDAVVDADVRQQWRLSAHLTAGLACFNLKEMDKAILMFREALEESNGNADVVCLLAEVLWSKGGEEERSVAKEQLFASIEKHPENVGAVTLLGVIGLLEGDSDTLEAVTADLESLRIKENLTTRDHSRIAHVLAGAVAVNSTDDEQDRLWEAARSIMMSPARPRGWSELASLSSEIEAVEMALKTSLRSVPPNGELDAKDLSKAFANSGSIADAQRAIFTAPWVSDGWKELA